MSGKDAKQHSGVMDPTGRFHPELAAALQSVSVRMYDLASRGASSS